MGKCFACGTTDNTSITINGSPISQGTNFYKGINVRSGDPPLSTTTITTGQYFLIEGEMYDGNGNMYVETSEPVYAFQGIGKGVGAEANQGLFFVPPLKCSSLGM